MRPVWTPALSAAAPMEFDMAWIEVFSCCATCPRLAYKADGRAETGKLAALPRRSCQVRRRSLASKGGMHGFGGCPGSVLQLKWNDFCIRSGLNPGKQASPYAIILSMELKQLMQVYQAGWKAVEEVQREERRSAPLDLRWRQLNAVYGLAKELGILQPDPSEAEVFKRWAILKDKATRQNPKA